MTSPAASELKRRDVYDLLWYLSDPDWPAPNLTLLNNALQQTGWDAEPLTADTWRQADQQRLHAVAWEPVAGDVRPFLASSADLGLLTRENLARVLGQRLSHQGECWAIIFASAFTASPDSAAPPL